MTTRSEIWIRLAAPADGGDMEAVRRIKQLTKAVERLSLELLEVRQVEITKGNTDED